MRLAGQRVLLTGATGGIGSFAVQYVLNGGGTPIGVVSSESRAEILRELGCEHIIDRLSEPTDWMQVAQALRGYVTRDEWEDSLKECGITPPTPAPAKLPDSF